MDIITYIIFGILLFICGFVCYTVGQKRVQHLEQLNNDAILQERQKIQLDIDNRQENLRQLDNEYNKTKKLIEDAGQSAEQVYVERTAALELQYSQKEKDLAQRFQQKQDGYTDYLNKVWLEYAEQIESIKAQLKSLKATRDAAIEAARQEQVVSDNPQIYQIQLAADEIHDIDYLNNVREKLIHKTVLGKYIWSVFFQKKFKAFAANLLGQDKVCGIYKITDQLTKESYVGQSKDVSKRWSDHIKGGCGAIEVSNANQLYAAMRRDGIENFSFELLEACEPQDLDAKEKYFIDLYSADTLGLNSKRGNQSVL